MILIDLGPDAVLYRAHVPRWAASPASGAGAAKAGGRFNRKGVEALYLALEDVTALREYQQTSPLLPPCTLCAYTASMKDIVDLRQLHHGAPWDELWHDWSSDWRQLAFDLHVEPPSWVLGDIVRSAGHAGIVFPSVANPGGSNIVIYPDQLPPGQPLQVFDADHRLPRDQASWA